MNAKDKAKMDIVKTMIGQMKTDVIVIDPENFRKEADIKNKEFYDVGKDADNKDETVELTDAEKLSCDIMMHLAQKTAERFEDMADGMEMSILKQIVRRIEEAEPEAIVPMIQSMFLARGMVDAAEELDLLKICSNYDEDVEFLFYDMLFDTDIFDWFSIENMLDDFHNNDERDETD